MTRCTTIKLKAILAEMYPKHSYILIIPKLSYCSLNPHYIALAPLCELK